MRTKKAWRKEIDQSDLQSALQIENRAKEVKAQQAAIPDSSLFKVAKKAGSSLKANREKLKKDRFKRKEQASKSLYEEVMVKKLIEKNERKAAMPPQPLKKTEEDEQFMDLWSDAPQKNSRNIAKFRSFSERTRVNVNPVVVPMAGQSYNPSAKDHQEVIQRVVDEEKREIEVVQKRLRTLKPYLFKEGNGGDQP